jgi:hypothetical protein
MLRPVFVSVTLSSMEFDNMDFYNLKALHSFLNLLFINGLEY